MIRFGLVTVLYNSVDVLEDFFKSLSLQTHLHWHLEVIDNSEGDESLNYARELAELYRIRSINFVKNPENYGVAKGNNQGIHNCLDLDCDYVILLNNDIDFPNPGLFSGIAAEIEGKGYDIIVPKIYYSDTGKLWFGGGRINEFSATVNHFGDLEDDSPRFSIDCFTGYAPTCFMVINRDVFSRVDMMDERYFVYYDDTDFVLRCLRAGLKLRYIGTLSLYHKVSSSTGGGASKFSIYYYNRNRLFFIKKNSRGLVFFIAMFWYFVTRFYKYCVYSADKRQVLAKAIGDGLVMGKVSSSF